MYVEILDREKAILTGLLMMARKGAMLAEDKKMKKLANKLISKFGNKSNRINIKRDDFDTVLLIAEEAAENAHIVDEHDLRRLEEDDEQTLRGLLKRFE